MSDVNSESNAEESMLHREWECAAITVVKELRMEAEQYFLCNQLIPSSTKRQIAKQEPSRNMAHITAAHKMQITAG